MVFNQHILLSKLVVS